MTDKTLKIFLDGLKEIVFIESVSGINGKVEKLKHQIIDMEAIIKIQGEWGREDLKDLLDTVTTINEQETRADERVKIIEEIEGWLVDCESKLLPIGEKPYCAECSERFSAELRAKLAELKGGK